MIPLLLYIFFILGALFSRGFYFGALIFMAPLYEIRFEITIPGTEILIPTTLLELAILAVLTIYINKIPYLIFQKTRLWYFPQILVLGSLSSIFFAPELVQSFGIFRAFFLEPFLIYVILADYLKSYPEKKPLIMQGFSRLLTWISLYSILGYIFNFGVIIGFDDIGKGRTAAFFKSPNMLALLIVPLIGIELSKHLKKHFRFTSFRKFLGEILPLILGIVTLYLTYSRAGYLACGVMIFIGFFKMNGPKIILPFILIGFISILLLYNSNYRVRSFFHFKTSIETNISSDNSTNVRKIIYDNTLSLIKKKPITGYGLTGFQPAYANLITDDKDEIPNYPHNIFLDFWTETGIITMIAFIFISFGIVWYSLIKTSQHDLFRSSSFALEIGLFIVGLLIHGLLDNPYFKNDYALLFWIILAFFESEKIYHEKNNPHS